MIMNAATLREILDHIPGDYEIEYFDNISHPLQDKVEVDISCNYLLFISYGNIVSFNLRHWPFPLYPSWEG